MMLAGSLLVAFALHSLPADSAVARDVTVAPGEALRVTTEGAGPPIVLIPGLFGSAFGYRRVIEPLVRAGYRTIVIEPLGTGWSAHPAGADYSLGAQAARLGRVLDRLSVRGATVVSHSVGTSIALRLALRRPELVGAIVSIDGGPAESAATPGLRAAMRYAGLLRLFVDRRAIEAQVRAGMIRNSGDTTWVTDSVVRGYTAGFARDARGAVDALLAMSDAREALPLAPRLHGIRVPVRLLIGTAPHESAVSAAQIEQLAAALPDCAVERVTGSGQYVQEEQPAAVVAAVRRLATGRSAGR